MAEVLSPGAKAAIVCVAMASIGAITVAAILTGHDLVVFLIGSNAVAACASYILGQSGKSTLSSALDAVRARLVSWLMEDAGPGIADILEDYFEIFKDAWPEFAALIKKALEEAKRYEEFRH